MTRLLQVVGAENPAEVLVALRSALAGGAAVLPGMPTTVAPSTVEQRIAVVVETSGSTGRPKQVALSTDALLASAAASDTTLGGAGQWLLALPVHYIAGINVLVRSIAAGTEPVIMNSGHFDPLDFVAASTLLDAPLRYTSLVPAQLARLVVVAEQDLGILDELRRFDRILIGGQASPPELIARCLEFGLNVTRTYGSSETSGGCVYDGVPIGSALARIVDGQVELAGPTLAESYLGDPERTADAFYESDGRRWYRTGDSGELVDDVLQVTGRLDGVLISGGVKVSLAAVERVVQSQPGLADAVAVRAPSAKWGEVPVVFSSGGARLSELRELVAQALGRASAPAHFVQLAAMPQLPGGKPDRVRLAELAKDLGGAQ